MKPMAKQILVRSLVTALVVTLALSSCRAQKESLSGEIDALLSKAFVPNEPGAAVIVVKDGKVLFRKGYGLADLELGIPIEPDMVFRLGSITKQFTAVAILMLEHQGKLSVKDDITKYLPDYPTHGQTITIEHLLTHTSGIKSYTSMPEWLALWRKDMSLKELIDIFKDQPPDFAPGEKWSYSNSGYILLGAIIENVSDETYENFIQKHIFEPLAMKHSHYGSASRIIPRRIPGYSKGAQGYENAAYLSMTQPFAAGSLLSSVDDLALWNAALSSEKLLKKENLEKAFVPYILNNGRSTGYGYGWAISEYQGHRLIEHGGGINGFTTYVLNMPEDKLFVAVLTNSDSGKPNPETFAFKIAALAIGKPYKEPVAVSLKSPLTDVLTGVYESEQQETVFITKDKDKVMYQRSGGSKTEIFPASETEFFFKDSFTRILFLKDDEGSVKGLQVIRRLGPPQEYQKTGKPLPVERTAIDLDPSIYDQYVGEYEIAPGFSLHVTREGDRLLTQATGQEKVEVFPESKTKFFLKDVDAQLEFVKDASGKVTGIILYQGGQKIPAAKKE